MNDWKEVRYHDDMREGLELRIALDDQGDVYVSVLPVGHKIGPTVRLCASGGAAERAPGLLRAMRQAQEAIQGKGLRLGDLDTMLAAEERVARAEAERDALRLELESARIHSARHQRERDEEREAHEETKRQAAVMREELSTAVAQAERNLGVIMPASVEKAQLETKALRVRVIAALSGSAGCGRAWRTEPPRSDEWDDGSGGSWWWWRNRDGLTAVVRVRVDGMAERLDANGNDDRWNVDGLVRRYGGEWCRMQRPVDEVRIEGVQSSSD